ncbi:MAG: outer membrane beta-barrel protein, partial [Saprospiraceae bacterium]
PEAEATEQFATVQSKPQSPKQSKLLSQPTVTTNTQRKLFATTATNNQRTAPLFTQLADSQTPPAGGNTTQVVPELNNNSGLQSGSEVNQSSLNSGTSSVETLNAQRIALLEKEMVKLEEKKKVEFFGATTDEKSAKSKGLNIGLELATYASAGAALDGYAGGAIVEVPTQSDKLNLRTGLNFNAQQRYFDSQVNAIQETDRGFSPSSVVIDPKPNIQVNAQQLSLPLTMEFKPRKSWGLEGGVQASYLLGARDLKGAEAYQTVAGFTNGNEAIRTFVSSLSNKQADFMTNTDPAVDNSKVNIDAFRRFDVAVTAGFGVYPTENIGVRLQYQRGLIDMLKADQFRTFGNNVRLSAVYFFGK